MSIGDQKTVLGPFRTLFAVGTTGDLTDGQLLERFSGGHAAVSRRALRLLSIDTGFWSFAPVEVSWPMGTTPTMRFRQPS